MALLGGMVVIGIAIIIILYLVTKGIYHLWF